MKKSAPSAPETNGNTISSLSRCEPSKVNQAKRWCFTYNNYKTDDIDLLQITFKKICVKYVFQREIGEETETPHLQGSIWLKSKMRWSEFGLPKQMRWSTMRNEKASIDYCQKSKTSVGEPFIYGFPKPLKIISNLWPWQQTVVDSIQEEPDERTINWIFDELGHNDKTMLCKYLAHKYGTLIATAGNAKDIANLLKNAVEGGKDLNDNTAFFFNIARDCEKISYNGFEGLKDGLMTNLKYECSTLVFNCPHVWIMSNRYPDIEKLSKDR